MKLSTRRIRTQASMVLAVVGLVVLAACSAPEDAADVDTVESITLNGGATSVDVAVGSTNALSIEIVATGDASTEVDWNAADTGIATVDGEGRVTGISEGTTTITATSVVDVDVSGAIEVNVVPTDEPTVNAVTIDGGTESRTVDAGAVVTLPVEVDTSGGADSSVTWSSSNDAAATVAPGGVVTAMAEGTTTITATSVVDGSVSDDIEIVVVTDGSGEDGDDGPTEAVTAVTINDGVESASVEEGASIALTVAVTATGGADDSVTWGSSDDTVATVDDAGTVTGVAEGSAVVTATSDFDGSVSDDITVDVTAPATAPAVTAVTINGGDASVSIEEDATASLTAVVTATGGADESVTWSSSDDSLVTVDYAGTVTGVAEGSAVVTATSDFDGSVSDDITVDVTMPEPDPVDPEALAAVVDSATTFTVGWTADPGATYEVRAVASSAATIDAGALLASDAMPSDTFDLPPSTTPLIRLIADGAVVSETYIEDFVYAAEDYDVYVSSDVDHSEDPIEGTIRRVLELAEPGSTIAFAPDIDTIGLYGVRLEGGDDARLMIGKDISILGHDAGVTLQGVSAYDDGDPGIPFSYSSRMLYIGADATVVLENLTITGGTFIYHGGGIMNLGSLTVRDSTITDNHAWYSGGGIRTAAGSTLVLEGSTISDNDAHVNADELGADYPIRGGEGSTGTIGDGGWGGGLWAGAGADVTITDTTFSGNVAKASGGGVYLDPDATVTMSGSDVQGNAAAESVGDEYSNYGGGIYTLGTLEYSGGDILNNTSDLAGGGLYVDVYDTNIDPPDEPPEEPIINIGRATVTDTFFNGNAAEYGGGIYHVVNEDGDNLDLVGVTYGAGNSAASNPSSADIGVEDPYASTAGLRRTLRAPAGASGRYAPATEGVKLH